MYAPQRLSPIGVVGLSTPGAIPAATHALCVVVGNTKTGHREVFTPSDNLVATPLLASPLMQGSVGHLDKGKVPRNNRPSARQAPPRLWDDGVETTPIAVPVTIAASSTAL